MTKNHHGVYGLNGQGTCLMIKQLAIASVLSLLIGCGSGGGGGDDAVDVSLTNRELNDISERLFAESLNNAGPDYTDIPTGRVQYEGASVLTWMNESGGVSRVRGAVEVTADLSTSGVTGEINRIIDASSANTRSFEGTLPIEGLSLVDEMSYTRYDGTGMNITDSGPLNLTGGTIIGTITSSEGKDVAFDTTINADFRGDSGQYIFGIVDGDVTDDGFATTIRSGYIAVENDTTILP